MTIKRTRWDVIHHLNTPEERAIYLDACIQEAGEDSAFMVQALLDIASAQGADDLATFAGVDPDSLSDGCELSFETFIKTTHALGIQLHAGERQAHAE